MLKENILSVYNAAAGSGKTTQLAKEYVSLMLSQPPEIYLFKHILAITFTNKATEEMKSRIRLYLKVLSDEALHQSSDFIKAFLVELKSNLKLSEKEIAFRARQNIRQILHQYSYFSVQTIDRFSLSLLRSFTVDLGFTPSLSLVLQTDDVLEESIDYWLNQLTKNDLYIRYLKSLIYEQVQNEKSVYFWSWLKENAKIIANDAFYPFSEEIKNLSFEDFNRVKESIQLQIDNFKTKNAANAAQYFSFCAQHDIPAEDLGPYKCIGDFYRYLQKHDYKDRSYSRLGQALQNQQLYAKSKANTLAYVDDYKDQILTNLSKDYTHYMEGLQRYYLNEVIFKHFPRLALFKSLELAIDEYKRQKGVFFLSDVNKIIHQQIKDQPEAYIYEKIGNYFQHYLIDEFQDTSILQWENLKPLVENQLYSGYGSLLVGDLKQAIYRFRGGDARQFQQLQTRSNPAYITEIHGLDVNYRSQKEIVCFNNDFYRLCVGYLNGYGQAIDAYSAFYAELNQKAAKQTDGYVEIHLTQEKLMHRESLEQLAQQINAYRKIGWRLSDMCLLVRSNKQIPILSEYLLTHDIEVFSQEAFLLKKDPHIQLILSVMRFFHRPDDLENRFHFAKHLYTNGYVNEVEPHDFFKTFIKLDNQSVLNLLSKNHTSIPIPSAYMDLYQWACALVVYWEMAKKENFYAIEAFLSYLDGFLKQNLGSGISCFLDNWQKHQDDLKIERTPDIDRLQTMTIHKAKGLEFNAVFLLADWDFFTTNTEYWVHVQEGTLKSVPCQIRHQNAFFNHSNKELEQNMAEVCFENLNLMYVATTRAVSIMHIFAPRKQAKETDLGINAAFFFNRMAENYGLTYGQLPQNKVLKEQNEQEELSKQNKERISSVMESWQNRIIISTESSGLSPFKSRTPEELGNLWHALLADVFKPEDVSFAIEKQHQLANIAFEEKKLWLKRLHRMVHDPKVFCFFQSDESYNEQSLVDASGKIYRLDRLARLKESWVLIDYKTGAPTLDHQMQISDYATLLLNSRIQVTQKVIIYISDADVFTLPVD